VDTKEGNDTINLTGVIHSAMVTGGGGPDTIIGGTKDDTIVWNTFDGSDVVDGGPGRYPLLPERQQRRHHRRLRHDTIAILQNGAGFALYRDSGNVSMDVQNTRAAAQHVHRQRHVATTGLVGTTQFLETIYDGLPDVDVRRGGLCPFAAPGAIETPGTRPVQYTNFANVSVINDTCVTDT
jgi:Ca2+-binding RTX toxin-like protein